MTETSIRYMLNDLRTSLKLVNECSCCGKTAPLATNPNEKSEGYCEACLEERLAVQKMVDRMLHEKVQKFVDVLRDLSGV